MARNYRQIIGKDGETNSKFIICWTPDGKENGGTSQAIRIANNIRIPTYNLFGYNSSQQFIDTLTIWNSI